MSLNLRRSIAIVVLVAAAVVLVKALTGEEETRHRLVITADQARYMRPGLEVRAAGQVVGRVETAEPTKRGTARVEISLDDEAWPLRRGTRATFRWPGTIGFTNRYVELTPSARGAVLPDGARIAGEDVTETVEVDDVAGMFDAAGRRALRETIMRSGPSVERAAPELPTALKRAPAAVDEAHAIVQDLAAETDDLSVLLQTTDAVVHEILSSSPDVGALVNGLNATFTATGGRAEALGRTLQQAPATLDVARTTLTRTESTLRRAERMLRRLDPGIRALRGTVAPLNATLSRVTTVAPDATATLATLRRASPDLDGLLERATKVVPMLRTTAEQAIPQLQCIRPYAPELAGFASTWSGFITRGDDKDKYSRTNVAVYPYHEGMGLTSADVAQLFPSLHYAFPRPPGEIANQPWFLPECGLGPETLDPTKDPEITR